MQTAPRFVDLAALRREFPDAREVSGLERDNLLAFWSEVAAAAARHGYSNRLDLITVLNHLTALLVAGDEKLKKAQRKKCARQTVNQLRSTMNLFFKHGVFVNPEPKGSA